MNLDLKTTLLITAIILLLKGVKFQSITVIVLSLKETKRRKNSNQKTLSGRLRRSRSEAEVLSKYSRTVPKKSRDLNQVSNNWPNEILEAEL